MKKTDNFVNSRENLISILQNLYENSNTKLQISSGTGKNLHSHQFYELFFLHDGRICINPKGEVHKSITLEERKRLNMTMWITRNQIDWTIMHCGFQSYADERLSKKISAIITYLQILPEILSHADTPDINSDCARVLTGTLLQIFKHSPPPTYEKTSTIERALLLIDKNYYDHTLSASNIAIYCGYTLQGLNAVFRRGFGRSVQQCLIRKRLSVAAFKLVNSVNSNVADIAFSCGWTDRAYFSNKFRQTYGIPPHTYRKQVLEGKTAPPEPPQPLIPFEGFFND